MTMKRKNIQAVQWALSALLLSIAFTGLRAAQQQDSSQQESPPPDSSSSLWDRVRAGVQQGVQKGLHPQQSQAGPGRSPGCRYDENDIHTSFCRTGLTANEWQGSVYKSIEGPGSFQGLFADQNHEQAQRGKLKWPRAAITFVEYGGSLLCWKVRAKIWTNPSASHYETFQICNAKIRGRKDALGRAVYVSPVALSGINFRLNQVDSATAAHITGIPDTGKNRTEGPNPPARPWNPDLAGGGDPVINRFNERFGEMKQRLAWISGFVNDDDLIQNEAASNLMGVHFSDARMWIVGFQPGGNADELPGGNK